MDVNGGNDLYSNPLFVNHAELAWHERRRAWVSDKPRKPIQRLMDPLTIWNTTYEDLATPKLLSTSIPLSDVDFLRKMWLDKRSSA